MAALLDAPSAFGSTYAAEVVRTDADWAIRARDRSTGLTERAFFAVGEADSPVGLVGVYSPQDRADLAHLISMW